MADLIVPKGVVSLTGAGNPIDAGLLNDRPDIDGVTIAQAWSDYETSEGVFDRSFFEGELPRVVAAGKYAVIGVGYGGGRVSLGGSKPEWLMDLIGADTFTFLRDGNPVTIPWFWHPTLIERLINMLTDFGQHFGNNPAVKVVHVNFANANTLDWAVPFRNQVDGVSPPGSTEVSRWITAGWTIPLMIDAARQIIDTAMTVFPNAFMYVALGEIKSPILDPAGPWNLAQTVLDEARLKWGNRLLPGKNSLTTYNTPSQLQIDNPPFACQALWRCFQDPAFRMLGGTNPNGLTDDQVSRLAFDQVKDASFYEVYLPDALNLLGAMAYGHNLLNPDSVVVPPDPGPGPGPIITLTSTTRALKFRDVVWGVAHKLGWITSCDPVSGGPSDDQFCELVAFANAWLRRLWDKEDWPEWTRILKVNPDTSHFATNPGRTLRMFLVDPDLTPAPIDAPFTLINGKVHCGFEHGSSVWLKYQPLAPVFTEEKWVSTTTYKKGEVVYSIVDGECYKSLIDDNRGHNPVAEQLIGRHPLGIEVTQNFAPGIETRPPTDEIWEVAVDDPPVYNVVSQYRFQVRDSTGVNHVLIYASGVGDTLADLLAGIEAMFAASVDPFIISLDFDDVPPNRIRLTLTTDTFGVQATVNNPSLGGPINLPTENTSDYNPGRAGRDEVPQITVLSLNPTLDLIKTLYTIDARDSQNGRHQVSYQSVSGEDLITTIAGIEEAISDAVLTDTWWGGVIVQTDADALTITFTNGDQVRYSAIAEVTPEAETTQFWELVVFPQIIAESVMRGMYSDALREEGQTDKAAVEEQAVVPELALATEKTVNQPADRMTDQQQSRSRYRM